MNILNSSLHKYQRNTNKLILGIERKIKLMKALPIQATPVENSPHSWKQQKNNISQTIHKNCFLFNS